MEVYETKFHSEISWFKDLHASVILKHKHNRSIISKGDKYLNIYHFKVKILISFTFSKNSCFCSLFLFSVNAVRAVITSRTISDSRYYKDEKRGFWDEKKFYISLNVYILPSTWILNIFWQKKLPSVPL